MFRWNFRRCIVSCVLYDDFNKVQKRGLRERLRNESVWNETRYNFSFDAVFFAGDSCLYQRDWQKINSTEFGQVTTAVRRFAVCLIIFSSIHFEIINLCGRIAGKEKIWLILLGNFCRGVAVKNLSNFFFINLFCW